MNLIVTKRELELNDKKTYQPWKKEPKPELSL
jgi:hypothetical protein